MEDDREGLDGQSEHEEEKKDWAIGTIIALLIILVMLELAEYLN